MVASSPGWRRLCQMTPETKDPTEETNAMTHTASFRCATRPDPSAIITLLADDPLGSQREVLGTTVHPDYIAAFEAISRDPNEFLAVAEQGGEVFGCLQISIFPGLSPRGMLRDQIGSVRIAANARGQGLGRYAICASPFPNDQSIGSFSTRTTITSPGFDPARSFRLVAIRR